MNLRKAITLLSLMTLAVICTIIIADIPLERRGNEAAATADSLYEQERFVEAAVKYEEAFEFFVEAQEEDQIPLEDKIEQMLANMVTSYYQGEDYLNTVRIIEKRLERDPSNVRFARQIAQIHERFLNDHQAAINVLEDFEEENNDFDVRRTLGRLHSAQENYQKSVEWYEKAFELRQDPDILQNIALLHHRVGNTEDAIKAYEDFIETEPRESVLVNIYRNMGRFYEEIGREEEAIRYYERSNRLRFNRDITLLLLTKYYDRGDYLNAKEKANRLLQDNPDNADAIYYMGLMLFEEGRMSEAKNYFERITDDRTYGSAATQYVESIESM